MSDMETVRIDLSACRNKAEVMQAFAEALRLPAYFGHNWDALWDLLRESPARRIEVLGWTALRRQAPAEAAALDALQKDLMDTGLATLIDAEGAPP